MTTIRAALDTFQQAANRGTCVYLSSELVQELREALKAELEPEAPSAADLLPANPPNIPTTMAMQYRSAWREGVEDGWSESRAILARRGHPPAAAPAPEADPSHINQLAAIIRKVDGSNSMGAAALAEAILEQYPVAFLVDPPVTPSPREVKEAAQWLLSMRELAGEHNPEERRQFTRAATLLQRLASLAYLVVDRPPEGFLDLLKSQPGEVQVCTAGVSIEPLRDAAHSTFQDAITLAEGCHDYSGGHTGTEGEAWHGAISTVVDVIKGAAVGDWDWQTRSVYGVGSEAQAGDVEA